MRAHEFLDEDWKKWGVPAIYAGINAAAFATSATGHGGDPDFLRGAPYEQSQDDYDIDDSSITVALPDAQPYNKTPDPSRRQIDKHGHTQAFSKDQATLLALTMWGEARGHGKQGMRSVGHVVMNRLKSDRNFGDSVKEVVWKRKAFSCWNHGDPNRAAMQKIASLPKDSLDYQRWLQAKKIAVQLLQGKLHDTTNGALFYHTAEIKPTWAMGQHAVSQVANHLFYRSDHKTEKSA